MLASGWRPEGGGVQVPQTGSGWTDGETKDDAYVPPYSFTQSLALLYAYARSSLRLTVDQPTA